MVHKIYILQNIDNYVLSEIKTTFTYFLIMIKRTNFKYIKYFTLLYPIIYKLFLSIISKLVAT